MAAENEQPHDAPIRDPAEEDFNQRQRLQEIWDARKSVFDYRREIKHSIGQQLSEEDGERHYHEELNQYLLVLQTLFVDVYPENGMRYWTGLDLGQQVVQPPDQVHEAEPHIREFQGLKSILQTPSREVITFTTETRQRHRGVSKVTASRAVTVPWHVLDNAFMHANGFLSTVGLEADIRDDEPKDGFLDL